MNTKKTIAALVVASLALGAFAGPAAAKGRHHRHHRHHHHHHMGKMQPKPDAGKH